jgi:hypothetical protein
MKHLRNKYTKKTNKYMNYYIKLYKLIFLMNRLYDIITTYIEIIVYKILPLYIPIIITANYDINYYVRYLLLGYFYINLSINDIILRQSIKLRINNEEINSTCCNKCSSNIVWNIQDNIANIIFYLLGTLIFRYNIITNIYWRSYIHSQPCCIQNKLCIQKSLDIQLIGIVFGIINYLIELLLCMYLPFDFCIIIMIFINFLIDCIIFSLDIKYNKIYLINILLLIVWKLTQFMVIGFIETKKRENENRDIISKVINSINHLRNNDYYRVILWKEFQSLDNFISLGKLSIFYREHILNIYDLLTTINYFLNNNTALIIARKTKLLHISTIFKPIISSEHHFYIKMFESRKIIEPFIQQILNDLEKSIKNTKNEAIYEELFNYIKPIENDKLKVIDSYY